MTWVYVYGERDGGTVKIGHTNKPTISARNLDREQMNNDEYVLLAGVRSPAIGEDITHRAFGEWRQKRGRRKEYYDAADQIVEWVLWLRQQWFVTFEDTATEDDVPEVHQDEWVPKPGRREKRPPFDPLRVVQDAQQLSGPLAGTAWDWIPDLTASFQDFFTPPELVAAAAEAMGGIDLDAASHWIANKRLHDAGVKVGTFFHVNKSAFTHAWRKRVWLNPPYKNNNPWFQRALEMMDTGRTEQMCMLSPVHVFTTGIAQPIVSRSSAMVILTPTPKFFNPSDPHTDRGTNLPHAILYWGHRQQQFFDAYARYGIPVAPAWSRSSHARPLDDVGGRA